MYQDIYSQFRDFPLFKKFKNLLNDRWGLDILIVIKRKEVFFYDNQKKLHNPIVKHLLSASIFKNYFIKAINDFLKQSQDIKKLKSVKKLTWKQTGLQLFIHPLILENEPVQATLVATGVAPQEDQELRQALLYIKSDQNIQLDQNILQKLSPADSVYLEKILQILSHEFFTLLQRQQKQKHIIKKLHRNQGSKNQGFLVGKSMAIQQLFEDLKQIKHHDDHILIEGEPGTGKKLIAKNIHKESSRSEFKFQIYNCSNFKSKILESEIFGYKKTETLSNSKNPEALITVLNKGTLILNNIEKSTLSFQSKLFQFLKDSSNINIKNPEETYTRIVALSSKNLSCLVKENTFHKDLYLKLCEVGLKTQSLNQRKKDIPVLIDHFLNIKNFDKQTNFSDEAMKALYKYPWPGNVRELENEIEKILLLKTENQNLFELKHLSAHIRASTMQFAQMIPKQLKNLKQILGFVEKQILMNYLAKHNWNKSKVARILGTSRTSIVLKSKEYNLDKESA